MVICDVCNKDVENLDLHKRRIHGGGEISECPHCEMKISRKDALRRHIRRAHPEVAEAASEASSEDNASDMDPAPLPEPEPAQVEGRMSDDESLSDEPGPSGKRKRGASPAESDAKAARSDPRAPLMEEDDGYDESYEVQDDGGDEALEDVVRENWYHIRRFADDDTQTYNIRLRDAGMDEVYDLLRKLHERQMFAYRVNLMPGLILQNIETAELRYFHAGDSKRAFEEDRLIRNIRDFERLLRDLGSIDIAEAGFERRPDTKWVLLKITNISISLFPVPSVYIGAPIDLPEYINHNLGLQNFTVDENRERYTDSACFWRCLAQHQLENNPRASHEMFHQRTELLRQNYHANCLKVEVPDVQADSGVTLQSLERIEEFFGIPIQVYRLQPRINADKAKVRRRRRRRNRLSRRMRRGPQRRRPRNPFILDEAEEDGAEEEEEELEEEVEQPDEDENEEELNEQIERRRELEAEAIRKRRFCTQLVRRPAKGMVKNAADEKRTLFLNIYEDGVDAHFSRIGNMDLYCKCFACSKDGCISTFSHRGDLNRHERRCKGAKVKELFPGNGFVPSFHIFEKLEHLLNINVPENDRYYSYYSTYDFESYNDTSNLPEFVPIVWPTPLQNNLPPTRQPSMPIEAPPADSSDFIKAHWVELHSRLGAAHNFCVLHRPRFSQLKDLLIGMAQLQTRPFRLIFKVLVNRNEKLVHRKVLVSDEVNNLGDLEDFLALVTKERIKEVCSKQRVQSVRIDVFLSKRPFACELIPASFSIATNVPGLPDFEDPQTGERKAYFCLSNGNRAELITNFVDKLYEISEEAGRLMRAKYQPYLDELETRWLDELKSMYQCLIDFMDERLPRMQRRLHTIEQALEGADAALAELREEREKLQEKVEMYTAYIVELRESLQQPAITLMEPAVNEGLFKDLLPSNKTRFYHHRYMGRRIRDLYSELELWCHQLPTFGFNSARFDLNLIRKDLLPELKERAGILLQEPVFPDGIEPSKLYTDLVSKNRNMTVLKKGNSYLTIATNRIRFLDMAKFCAEGTSYSDWLKSKGVTEQKFFWPHELFTSLAVLEQGLPPKAAFFSTLKNEGISDAEYQAVQEKWRAEGWTSLRQHLEYYNSMDTIPFLTGIQTMCDFYAREFKIDVLSGQCITLPGLAERCLHRSIPDHHFFPLPQVTAGRNNRDLFDICKRDTVGGQSIVNIRKVEIGDRIGDPETGPVCEQIIGYDANSLYPWSSAEPQCTQFARRYDLQKDGSFSCQDFYPKVKSEICWLEWESYTRGCKIWHRFNGGIPLFGKAIPRGTGEDKLEVEESNMKELRILGYQVDGYCSQTRTIFFFDGCRWHDHECPISIVGGEIGERGDAEERNRQTQQRKRDLHRREVLAVAGYQVVVMTECQWRFLRRVNQNPTPAEYIASRQEEMVEKKFYKHLSPYAYDGVTTKPGNELRLTEFLKKFFLLAKHGKFTHFDGIINAVRRGTFYGVVVCDLNVPPEFRDYFAQQPPIFKNCEVGRADIGPHMRRVCEENGWLERPTRMLIGSYHCTEMGISTPLLKWLLDHDVVCTRVYKAFEFKPLRPFQAFVEKGAQMRRESDKKPELAADANTWKLILNSIYGKSITRQEDHENILIVDRAESERKAADKRFRRRIPLSGGLHEVAMGKRTVVHNLNFLFGFLVYGNSKKRMLEFAFDFVWRFVDPKQAALVLQDTDSAYFAFAAKELEQLVPKEKKADYLAVRDSFLPRLTEPEKSYDSRTPGLLKEEYRGRGVVALNPKTHVLKWTDEEGEERTKSKHKGISRRHNEFTYQQYKSVLETGRSIKGRVEQILIAADTQTLVRHSSSKIALSYAYYKRQLLEDGIRTVPLLI